MGARLRFIHYRTWTFGIARPACHPGISAKEKARAKKLQQSPNREKVTCPQCKLRMGWLSADEISTAQDVGTMQDATEG